MMTTHHRCPATTGGQLCRQNVSNAHLLCPIHWSRVSKPTQAGLYATWRALDAEIDAEQLDRDEAGERYAAYLLYRTAAITEAST